MFNKFKALLALLILASICVVCLTFVFRNHEPAREWRIESIKVLPVSDREAKLGYDSKVVAIIYPTGKTAPKIKNGVLSGGEIICEDAHFVLSLTKTAKKLQQKPRMDVNVGSPVNGSTVSFLYNKEDLPKGKVIFQGTIKGRNWYNIHEPGKIRPDFRDFPGVPVNIRIK
jgi:hypothetical protein